MPEIIQFKSGKDLVDQIHDDDDEIVTCIDCGAHESDQGAYEKGWQLAPPVCPNCLKWTLVADECCFGRPS